MSLTIVKKPYNVKVQFRLLSATDLFQDDSGDIFMNVNSKKTRSFSNEVNLNK